MRAKWAIITSFHCIFVLYSGGQVSAPASRLSDQGAAVQAKKHFSELMTAMINLDDAANSIKMVGPSINCEGTVRLPGGQQRSNPHVQSFAVATDQTGAPFIPCCAALCTQPPGHLATPQSRESSVYPLS
jgi:hypothetical protein